MRKFEWRKESARVDKREKVKGELEIEERLRSGEKRKRSGCLHEKEEERVEKKDM